MKKKKKEGFLLLSGVKSQVHIITKSFQITYSKFRKKKKKNSLQKIFVFELFQSQFTSFLTLFSLIYIFLFINQSSNSNHICNDLFFSFCIVLFDDMYVDEIQ